MTREEQKAERERELLRTFLGADPALGAVSVWKLADRLYARGLRAPVKR